MSHFTVLVIGEDVDAALAPFNESIEVESYKDRISLDDAGRAFAFVQNAAAEDVEDMVKRHAEQRSYLGAAGLAEQERETRAYHAKCVLQAADLNSPDPKRQHLAQLAALQDYHGGECGQDAEGFYQLSTYNPDSKWDWYVIGGRWRGMFQLTADAVARQAGVVGTPGTGEALDIRDGKGEYKDYSGTADQARKGDIDFKAMRMLAAAEADARYDAFEAARGDLDLQDVQSWPSLVTRVDAAELTIDAARELYHAQPLVQALRSSETPRWYDLEPLLAGRDAYVKAAADASFVPYAFVFEGKWYGKGEMGWFGTSHGDADQASWNSQVVALIESLPEDALLTNVDCHI